MTSSNAHDLPGASSWDLKGVSILLVEDSWHLGCLVNTCDTLNVPRMGDLVGQGS